MTEKKDWNDILFGKQAPPPATTTEPEPKSQIEILAGQTRRTGQAIGDLISTLQGESTSPVRTCSQGHLVPPGSTMCTEGHYVG